ncbi:MAG: hypothetical protein JKY54_11900 [Flavobacteriales bacterium]|nr:hypothetical protein [Flavobacteriales bacterium]
MGCNLIQPNQTDQATPGGPVVFPADTNSTLITHSGLKPTFSDSYDSTKTKIIGNLKQGLQNIPMTFSMVEIEKEEVKRPQTPKESFSYSVQNLLVTNSETGLKVGATLALPIKLKV